MVTVEVDLGRSCHLYEVAAVLEFLLLTFGEAVCAIAIVYDQVYRLEGDASSGEISHSHMGNAAIYIVVPVPSGIHAPVDFIFFSFGIDVKHDVISSHFHGLHIVGTRLGIGTQRTKSQNGSKV